MFCDLILLPYVHNSIYNMTDSNSNTSSNNSEFETELPDMETWKKVSHKNYSNHRTYSRPFLEVIITPNLVPWVLTKIFSLEMVKNDVFKACKKTKYPFFRKKNAPMALTSTIGPVSPLSTQRHFEQTEVFCFLRS